jgi:hypothetical protein
MQVTNKPDYYHFISPPEDYSYLVFIVQPPPILLYTRQSLTCPYD